MRELARGVVGSLLLWHDFLRKFVESLLSHCGQIEDK
jgi:hypothetical protein